MIMMSDNAHAVEFHAVSKSFGGKQVLNELNLKIPKGTTFGLLGPNGAGKSTSLKALMGLHEIDGGSLHVFGNNLSEIRNTPDSLALRQRVGYVPEVHSIYRWMTVQKAIRFVKAFRDTWNDRLEKELLELFELPPNRKVSQLSKGMLAKLSLLLAVAPEPDLLVLDEPTSGLDPIIREDFLHGILKTISGREQTVVFSSHSIGDVERIADRVGVLKNGKLIVDQTIEQILSSTKRLRAALKDDSRPQWTPSSAIWQQVNRREWQLTVQNFTPEIVDEVQVNNPVDTVEVRDLSLEDIFKDYVRSNCSKEVSHA